jgi:putative NADPH-quinone reductase
VAERISLIQGHPDPDRARLGRARAEAYAHGAEAAGRQVRIVDVAALDFPLLGSRAEFEQGPVPADVVWAQEAIHWAEHLVIVYPLWLGGMPARLKGFLEQVLRPDFAFDYRASGRPGKPLAGRSARIVVTMGMPVLVYRWYFRAHSLKSLERNILGFCGIAPVSETLLGMIESGGPARRRRWLARLRRLGARGR